MFGIGLTELLVIFVLALLFIGPKGLPGFARKLGKVFGYLSENSREFYRVLTQVSGSGEDDDDVPNWYSDVAPRGNPNGAKPRKRD